VRWGFFCEDTILARPFKPLSLFFILLLFSFTMPSQTLSQEKGALPPPSKQSGENSSSLTLSRAAICEGIRDYAPENQAVVFSVTVGRIFCFTHFDPVPKESEIYHSWDELTTRKKLSLRPPRWSTYSSIQLREYDKGPWRVTITDQADVTFGVVRFSITD
jgi:hypothetical protein